MPVCSIVRTNVMLRALSYLVVSSLRMATSRNMNQPDKVKYKLIQYVHLLVLRDCKQNFTCLRPKKLGYVNSYSERY